MDPCQIIVDNSKLKASVLLYWLVLDIHELIVRAIADKQQNLKVFVVVDAAKECIMIFNLKIFFDVTVNLTSFWR